MVSRKRSARRKRRERKPLKAPAFITRNIPATELVSEDNLDLIEQKADELLRDVGMDFRSDAPSLDIWRKAGARVEGERVYFEPGFLRETLKTAPRSFVQLARNPEKSVTISPETTVFVPSYGMPFVHDLDGGRRYGTGADFDRIIKLAHNSPWMHHTGGVVCEPVDIPVDQRHLAMNYSHIRWSDKAFMGAVTSGERAEDTLQMVRLVFGADTVANSCVLTNLININSPLVLDGTMLAALRTYAAAGQALVITPFLMGGAMGPVTVAAMVTQALAECMAGCALVQLINPGCPVIFGALTSGLNMKTGAPVRGAESWASVIMLGQIARRLNLPFRAGAASTASKTLDSQAGQESASMLLSSQMAGVNFQVHAAGQLEAGLTFSYEKFMQDSDYLGILHRYLAGVDLGEDEFGLDAFAEVGPGEHYLGAQHTLERYEDAFYGSDLIDSNSFEQWSDDGSRTMLQRANSAWKKSLDEYVDPGIDPAIDEALKGFMERRCRELASGSSV